MLGRFLSVPFFKWLSNISHCTVYIFLGPTDILACKKCDALDFGKLVSYMVWWIQTGSSCHPAQAKETSPMAFEATGQPVKCMPEWWLHVVYKLLSPWREKMSIHSVAQVRQVDVNLKSVLSETQGFSVSLSICQKIKPITASYSLKVPGWSRWTCDSH